MNSNLLTIKSVSQQRDQTSCPSAPLHASSTALSEPEDSMSSSVESFDDDDMYPFHYDDEAVSNGLESDKESDVPVGNMVFGYVN